MIMKNRQTFLDDNWKKIEYQIKFILFSIMHELL